MQPRISALALASLAFVAAVPVPDSNVTDVCEPCPVVTSTCMVTEWETITACTTDSAPTNVITTAITSATVEPTTTTTTNNIPNPTDLPDSMVYWHNLYRARNNASALTWNATIASSLEEFASKCSGNYSQSGLGENSAFGIFSNPAYYVYSWYMEYQNYDFSNPEYVQAAGHFTQLVWKSSTQFGCAFVDSCTKTDATGKELNFYLVCDYAPYGNFDSGFADNVQAAITTDAVPIPQQNV